MRCKWPLRPKRSKALNFLMDTNSCLINYYENGKDFIPRHIDSIVSFGPTPIIINLSIGATRVLRVNEKDFSLHNNSLFIIQNTFN